MMMMMVVCRMLSFVGVLVVGMSTLAAAHQTGHPHVHPHGPGPYHAPAPVYHPVAPAPYHAPAPVYHPAPAPHPHPAHPPAAYRDPYHEDGPYVPPCANYPYCDDSSIYHLQHEIDALRHRATLIQKVGENLHLQQPNQPFVQGL